MFPESSVSDLCVICSSILRDKRFDSKIYFVKIVVENIKDLFQINLYGSRRLLLKIYSRRLLLKIYLWTINIFMEGINIW